MNGKLDCQLVIEMIGRTWDRQFAQYASQPDGPLKGAGGLQATDNTVTLPWVCSLTLGPPRVPMKNHQISSLSPRPSKTRKSAPKVTKSH